MTKDWPVKSHTRFRYSPRTYRKVNPRLPVPIDLGDERITVAVGTTIADRSPHRTVRCVYALR